jgi:hypothetical protein
MSVFVSFMTTRFTLGYADRTWNIKLIVQVMGRRNREKCGYWYWNFEIYYQNTYRYKFVRRKYQKILQDDSKGFWRCRILGIIVFLSDFVNRLIFYRTQSFGNWICFCAQVRGWETSTLLGPIKRANINRLKTQLSRTFFARLAVSKYYVT